MEHKKYIIVYYLVKKYLEDHKLKYGIYLHDLCHRRVPDFYDRFKGFNNFNKLCKELVYLISYIE